MKVKHGGLVLAGVLFLLMGAGADFGEDTGFSGRVADCTACHAPSHPTQDTAQVVLEGLPRTWLPGQEYPLTIRVEGGPDARPAPFARGGFSIEAERGRFQAASGHEERVYEPAPGRLSYTDEGSLHREWDITWTAPGLETRPGDIRLWLAVLAADGGHLIGTDEDDQSERYDSTDTLTAAIPADPLALEAWQDLPLAAPETDADRYEVRPGSLVTIEGRHGDGNATELWWRLDDGPWQMRQTGTDWRLIVPEVARGGSDLWLRSASDDRSSPTIQVTIDAPGPLARLTPMPLWLVAAALTLAWRHRP